MLQLPIVASDVMACPSLDWGGDLQPFMVCSRQTSRSRPIHEKVHLQQKIDHQLTSLVFRGASGNFPGWPAIDGDRDSH